MPERGHSSKGSTRRDIRWPPVYTWILAIACLIAVPCLYWGFGYLLISTSSWRQQEPNTAIYRDGRLKISAPEMPEGRYTAAVVKGHPMSKTGALRKAGVVIKDEAMEYEGQTYKVLCQAKIWVVDSSCEYYGILVRSTWAIDDLLDEESKRLIEGGDAAVVILTDKSAFYFLITK